MLRGMNLSEPIMLPCAVYRGGSSKAVFLRRDDLPSDPALADALILALFGSPDRRQIDGLGGADPLTSKVAIVSASHRPSVDVDFTFGQVSLTQTHVDYRSTCGNISSAVGAFAVDQGWVAPQEPATRVRIWNTNSQALLLADVPVRGGRSALDGDCEIAGVPGRGPCVRLDFGNVVGKVTGRLLPTGQPQDLLRSASGEPIPVSIVDAGSVCVFVCPQALGLPSALSPQALQRKPDWLQQLEAVRGAAAQRLGFVPAPEVAATRSPAVPKLILVDAPQDYQDSQQRLVAASAFDVLGRALSNQLPHQAYPVTGAICTATAAHIPGTLVHSLFRPAVPSQIRIGHPGGVLNVTVALTAGPEGAALTQAVVERTARELMRGLAFLPRDRVQQLYQQLHEQGQHAAPSIGPPQPTKQA
jgi:2-methylaconitate cis-trans-isomerase PrpF